MKTAWGCVEKSPGFQPTFVYDLDGEQVQSWRCPVRFVSSNVWDWLGHYNYHQKFPGAIMPGYEDVGMKYRQAMRMYETAYATGRKRVRDGR